MNYITKLRCTQIHSFCKAVLSQAKFVFQSYLSLQNADYLFVAATRL